MGRLKFLALSTAAVITAGADLAADDVRPAQIHIREQEPATFLVQWQVPRVVPRQGTPTPVLPADCEAHGDAAISSDDASWMYRRVFRCDRGLAGRELRVNYPLSNPSLSIVLRVELLSGERFAQLLSPGENVWQVPAPASPHAPLEGAQRAVFAGAAHVLDHPVHVAFVIGVVLLGTTTLMGRFSAGQLAGVGVAALGGTRLDPSLAEAGLSIGALLLAREALRPNDDRRQLPQLAMAAGAAHGLGLGAPDSSTAATLAMVLGMDVSMWSLAAAGMCLARFVPRTVTAYAAGAGAVALALHLVIVAAPELGSASSNAATLPNLTSSWGESRPSFRIAPRTPDAPIQSFIAIGPFEVRHEILVRLADVVGDIGLEPTDVLSLDVQRDVKARALRLVLDAQSIAIDGVPADGDARVDFMTVDAGGSLPRTTPVPESVSNAFIGVSVSYLAASTPRSVELSWLEFPERAQAVPSTIIDPEMTRAAVLTSAQPVSRWTNQLTRDPVPTVEAMRVEPTTMPLPLLALPFLAAALFFARRAVRGHRPDLTMGLSRVALAAAIVAAPIGTFAVTLPSASAASPDAARRILAGILPNVYRAFEFRDESQAYDRLAMNVTGDTLTDIYLEHQRALEMEERGGARARVEAVEVGDVSRVEPRRDGFETVASWRVGGTVTHFGHRHFRQNRYDARVHVVPVDGLWKIRTVEILEEQRVR